MRTHAIRCTFAFKQGTPATVRLALQSPSPKVPSPFHRQSPLSSPAEGAGGATSVSPSALGGFLHAGAMVAAGAEGYVNRYRRGWETSVAAVKQFVEEARRGRGRSASAATPSSQLPAPLPLPKHTWPVTQVSRPRSRSLTGQRLTWERLGMTGLLLQSKVHVSLGTTIKEPLWCTRAIVKGWVGCMRGAGPRRRAGLAEVRQVQAVPGARHAQGVPQPYRRPAAGRLLRRAAALVRGRAPSSSPPPRTQQPPDGMAPAYSLGGTSAS